MAGASRFMTLLAAPIPLLIHRHPRPFLLRLSLLRSSAASLPPLSSSSLSSICRPKLCSPVNSSQKFHSQSNSNTVQDDHFGVSLNHPSSHPWPEWSKFVESLSSCGNFFQERGAVRFEDEFVAYEELSEEFVRASHGCLAFSRERSDLLRLLSRRHIKVVVENGTPFLFKSALDTSRRMRSFLGIGGENVLESDKAQTADLMKYLLSYASDPAVSSGRGGLCRGELLESSVRNLFTELSRLCSGAQEPDPSMTYNLAEGYGQTQRPIGQKIEMKRGDWICSKCNFMNFARNMKCLECKETRPKRQLTGGEWECPQCDFYNYGRNQVCLRCDCKRPGEASYGANSSSGLGHENLTYANKPDIDSRLAANEEKARRWFGKISQMDGASDLSSAAADEDFPEIMPLRKGENRFVGSTRKTPLQRRLANSQYQQNLSNEGLSQGNDFQRKGLNPKGRDSSYADYVPLPSDMYAKKPQVSKVEDGGTAGAESSDSLSSSMPMKQVESSDKVNEQDGKSETWFKKLAELHDDKGVSTISNGDFPETMPTRTGQNRFVVSKTKDRSLTSPMYKRKMAVEKAGNTNFVPFVPFPPDYFAKKDKEPNMGDPVPTAKTETPSSVGPDRAGDWSDRTSSTNPSPITENQQMESTKRPSLITENRKTGSTRQLGNENSYAEWKGKSLEGSAVPELDPLDMSEEAKAQRWFRRVAQIKDISELSQIPDEDFPSIMPMRKGVNRFVVSKRKTPLERRLTSPQYKRNLPIVSSDPPKRENESS